MLLSEVEFGALLSYCPHGDSKAHLESQQWMRYLKSDQHLTRLSTTTSSFVAARLRARLEEMPFATWFGKEVVLVPIPRSAPAKEHGLWVPERIARALAGSGLGRSVLNCVRRERPVPKSSLVPAAMRPKFKDHFDSLALAGELPFDQDFLLIDDVVTRGATLLAAAARLKAAAPSARVRAFALMRTVSNPEEFAALFSPVVGKIQLAESGECFRRP